MAAAQQYGSQLQQQQAQQSREPEKTFVEDPDGALKRHTENIERMMRQREINTILRTEDLRRRFTLEGAEPGGGTPGDLAAFIRRDHEKWGALVRSAGIRAE